MTISIDCPASATASDSTALSLLSSNSSVSFAFTLFSAPRVSLSSGLASAVSLISFSLTLTFSDSSSNLPLSAFFSGFFFFFLITFLLFLRSIDASFIPLPFFLSLLSSNISSLNFSRLSTPTFLSFALGSNTSLLLLSACMFCRCSETVLLLIVKFLPGLAFSASVLEVTLMKVSCVRKKGSPETSPEYRCNRFHPSALSGWVRNRLDIVFNTHQSRNEQITIIITQQLSSCDRCKHSGIISTEGKSCTVQRVMIC